MVSFHLILVSVIQGVTEFLPVSSSGHLVLIPTLTSAGDQTLTIDVAAHIGTLLAVIIYFRHEVKKLLNGFGDVCRGQFSTSSSLLFQLLVVATIPVVIVGLIIYFLDITILFRSFEVVGSTTLIFGIVLYACDRTHKNDLVLANFTLKHAWILGLFQILALVPGTSRSGIVISGARLLGFSRRESVRVAMLMSIPTIIAAGTLSAVDLISNPIPGRFYDSLVVITISFISALGALAVMMRLLKHVSFTPFVIYRIILGSTLLYISL